MFFSSQEVFGGALYLYIDLRGSTNFLFGLVLLTLNFSNLSSKCLIKVKYINSYHINITALPYISLSHQVSIFALGFFYILCIPPM